MNIKPLKITYLIPKDETTFLYVESVYGHKDVERTYTIKGRYLGKRTDFEVTNYLKDKLEMM